jgi:hypothetical protein
LRGKYETSRSRLVGDVGDVFLSFPICSISQSGKIVPTVQLAMNTLMACFGMDRSDPSTISLQEVDVVVVKELQNTIPLSHCNS